MFFNVNKKGDITNICLTKYRIKSISQLIFVLLIYTQH